MKTWRKTSAYYGDYVLVFKNISVFIRHNVSGFYLQQEEIHLKQLINLIPEILGGERQNNDLESAITKTELLKAT